MDKFIRQSRVTFLEFKDFKNEAKNMYSEIVIKLDTVFHIHGINKYLKIDKQKQHIFLKQLHLLMVYKNVEFYIDTIKIPDKIHINVDDINKDIDEKVCNNNAYVYAERIEDNKLRLNFNIQSSIEEDVYDDNIRMRLEHAMSHTPNEVYDLDKFVYPRGDVVSVVNEIYECPFDTDQNHFVVWIDKKKIEDVANSLIKMIDSDEKLVVGFISDTALVVGPDDKYQIDVYSKQQDAVDILKCEFHKFSRYIYYQRTEDDIKLRITTKAMPDSSVN